MKTQFGFLKYLLPLLFIFACAKDNNNRNTTSPYNSTYYLSNGQCYSSTGQVVQYNYCSTSGQNGYYMANGYCYSPTGQVVDNTYCSNATGYRYVNGQCVSQTGQVVSNTYCASGGVGTGYSQQCQGIYYYNSGYGYQQVTCYGTNCSGYTLMNQQYQMVRCL